MPYMRWRDLLRLRSIDRQCDPWAGCHTGKHSLFCDCRSRQHQPDAAYLNWLCLQRHDPHKQKLRYQFSLFYFVRLFKSCMDKAARRTCLSLGMEEQH